MNLLGKISKKMLTLFQFAKNGFAQEELDNVKKITNLIQMDVKTIFDIGANNGSEIAPFYKIYGKKIQVFAFECDERAFQSLVKKNSKVNCYNLAMSDRCGIIDYYPSLTNCGRPWTDSGSLRKPKKHLEDYPNVKFGEPKKVTSITIDQFCKDHNIGKIDLIWMDVQGLETEVLLGAKKMLKNISYIYTESYTEEIFDGQHVRSDLLKVVSECFEIFAEIDDNNLLLKNKNI